MNRFKHNIDYLMVSSLDNTIHSFRQTYENFFTTLKKIRTALGKKEYWLDTYVRETLKAVYEVQITNNAETGFINYTDFRGLCQNTSEGIENIKHPLYPKAKSLTEKYREDFLESYTVTQLLVSNLFPDFLDSSIKQFINENSSNLCSVIDSPSQIELFNKLSGIVGEEQMEYLNDLIKHLFLNIMPLDMFIQGRMYEVIPALFYRDPETAKFVFQII